jgi:hypothetical protein
MRFFNGGLSQLPDFWTAAGAAFPWKSQQLECPPQWSPFSLTDLPAFSNLANL